MRISDVTQYILAQVKGCPSPIIHAEAVWAAKEFLEDTRAWRHVARNISIIPGVEEYDIPTPEDSEPCAVYNVVMDHKYIIPCMYGDGEPDIILNAYGFAPRGWRFINDKLVLYGANESESDNHTFDVSMALTVSGSNPYLPSWLSKEAIVNGSLYKIYGIAGQDWFNADLSMYYKDRFEGEIAKKRISRIHGGKPGSYSIQAPLFGG